MSGETGHPAGRVCGLPALSDEQRREYGSRAVVARRKRAALKADLKAGRIRPTDVLCGEEYAKAPYRNLLVRQLIAACPKCGKAAVRDIMLSLHLTSGKRLGGLGARQRERLATALEAAAERGSEERRFQAAYPSATSCRSKSNR